MTNAPDPEPDRPDSPPDPGDLAPEDQSEIDREFAEIISRFHTTTELPGDPEPLITPDDDDDPVDEPTPPTAWADDHPLFVFDAPPPRREPDPDEERYVPEPPPPLPRPSWPTLLATISLAYATLAMIALILGAPLPVWAGVLAIIGFVVGCAILAFRLPRNRPPGSDDGAIL
ncbi:hypothetical protein [Microlunatus speluncae]|uniref:hypothetical protein n=1 Tax=Microlunatus speluncae TaxID=2594267 RepID=UPI0012668886|nr:hypothetical protein [Microlunatus speluncae]